MCVVQDPMAILMWVEWFRPRRVCWLEVLRVLFKVVPRASRHRDKVVDMISFEIAFMI